MCLFSAPQLQNRYDQENHENIQLKISQLSPIGTYRVYRYWPLIWKKIFLDQYMYYGNVSVISHSHTARKMPLNVTAGRIEFLIVFYIIPFLRLQLFELLLSLTPLFIYCYLWSDNIVQVFLYNFRTCLIFWKLQMPQLHWILIISPFPIVRKNSLLLTLTVLCTSIKVFSVVYGPHYCPMSKVMHCPLLMIVLHVFLNKATF